jgi:DUF4097 and DUF4098 domain-containing protein YvlB
MRRRALILAAALSTLSGAALGQTIDFQWSGQVAQGKTIEIKGVNGDIRAEPAAGNLVEVEASKRARRSDPESVRVEVIEHDGNVTICAVYPTPSDRSGRLDDPNECRPGDEGRMNTRNNDTRVDFRVRVPAGVRLVAHNVNGGVMAASLRSDVEAYTVNGGVTVTTTGLVSAESVNGAINVTMGAATWSEPLDYRTVNGSITLNLPASVAAEVRAETMNGSITSDFPMTIQSSRRRGRRITGSIGTGGRPLHISTVNGSVRLRSAN